MAVDVLESSSSSLRCERTEYALSGVIHEPQLMLASEAPFLNSLSALAASHN